MLNGSGELTTTMTMPASGEEVSPPTISNTVLDDVNAHLQQVTTVAGGAVAHEYGT